MAEPAFFLLMHTERAVAEIMAECPTCGAIATHVLELAWRAGSVTCGECATAMPVTPESLKVLRRQAVDALAAIEPLLAGTAPR